MRRGPIRVDANTGSRFFDSVVPIDGDNKIAHDAVKAALQRPGTRRDLFFMFEHLPASELAEIRYKKDEILRSLRELVIDNKVDIGEREWRTVRQSFDEDEEPGMAIKSWHLLANHPRLDRHAADLIRFGRDYESRPFRRLEDTPVEARPDTPPLLTPERSRALDRVANYLRAGLLSQDQISRRNAASLLSVISTGCDLGQSFTYLSDALVADRETRGFARTTVYFVVAMQRILEAVTSSALPKHDNSRRMIKATLGRVDVLLAVLEVTMWLLEYPKLDGLANSFLRRISLIRKGCE